MKKNAGAIGLFTSTFSQCAFVTNKSLRTQLEGEDLTVVIEVRLLTQQKRVLGTRDKRISVVAGSKSSEPSCAWDRARSVRGGLTRKEIVRSSQDRPRSPAQSRLALRRVFRSSV